MAASRREPLLTLCWLGRRLSRQGRMGPAVWGGLTGFGGTGSRSWRVRGGGGARMHRVIRGGGAFRHRVIRRGFACGLVAVIAGVAAPTVAAAATFSNP